MRKQLPTDGDERFVKLFALFPTILDDNLVWLEFVVVKQEYSLPFPYYVRRWTGVRLAGSYWDKEEDVQAKGVIARVAHWMNLIDLSIPESNEERGKS